MAEFNGPVSEKDKTVAITKVILNLMDKTATSVHRRDALKIGHDLLY
jgi:hypothetical protein